MMKVRGKKGMTAQTTANRSIERARDLNTQTMNQNVRKTIIVYATSALEPAITCTALKKGSDTRVVFSKQLKIKLTHIWVCFPPEPVYVRRYTATAQDEGAHDDRPAASVYYPALI
jgi:hypothetical protein